MASCGFCWSVCFFLCCLSIRSHCHINPRLSHHILPALLKRICLIVRSLLSYWEHNVDSTPQNLFSNSSISRDHMWLLSFSRLLGKEMPSALICSAGQGWHLPRTSKSRNENQTNWNWYTQLETPQFFQGWILLQVTIKYAWTTEDHEISIVSNRDWSTAPSDFLPDLEVTANK